jgi:hypothetical protein
VLDARRLSISSSSGPFQEARGIDGESAWLLTPSGTSLRLRADESVAVAIQAEAWLHRRAYLSSTFDATCAPDPARGGKLVVRALAHVPSAGDPVLFFDHETAALLRAELPLVDAERGVREYESWSTPDADTGVRWPLAWSGKADDGTMVRTVVTSVSAGLRCRWLDGKGGPATEISGDACLDIRRTMHVSWPSSGRVRVPMHMIDGLIVVPARVGDHEAWALLDSGAGAQTVERGSTAASAFRPWGQEQEGYGGTQAVRFEIGTIDAMGIGELAFAHVPAERLKLPKLPKLGTKRPEIILGWPLFAMAAVRIDYVRDEVTFAADATTVVAKDAIAVPLHVGGSTYPLAEVLVEGQRGMFLVDTGSSGAVDFVKEWADKHGFPGKRPSVERRSDYGLGEAETNATIFTLANASLGPIHLDGSFAFIHDPGDHGITAGIVGERVLAKCSAVVFDVARRSLWVEPPCDRDASRGWLTPP